MSNPRGRNPAHRDASASARSLERLMRWVITLSASKVDAERLAAASIEGLSAHTTEPGEVLLEFHDSYDDESTSETRQAVKKDIDLRVRHVNGFGKLRWGRGFEGVEVTAVRSFDSTGAETQHVFPGPAYAHMQAREFADMVQRLGHARPPLPTSLEVIEALDAAAVTELADSNPVVGRVLHLVELMLEGDARIDWGAAYSALEAVEHDLHDRGVDGRALGWWTRREREDFKPTANSVEALGVAARHGVGGAPEPRMSYGDASWYVRRVTAHWLTLLLQDRRLVSDRRDTDTRPSPLPAFMRCSHLRAAPAGAAPRAHAGRETAHEDATRAGPARVGLRGRAHQPGLARRPPAPPEGEAGRCPAPTPRSLSHQAGSSGTGSPSSMSTGREASHPHSRSEARVAQLSIHTLRSAG